MDAVKKIDNKLEQYFKGLPALSDSSKEVLATAWAWIALVFGVLQLLAALGLWNLIRTAERAGFFSNYYVDFPGALTSTDKTMIYVGIIILVVDAVILLMAYPELKQRARRGWNLLFLAALLNVAYSVVTLFISQRGVGSFVLGLLSSAVGFYLLYQVKAKFAGTKSSAPKK